MKFALPLTLLIAAAGVLAASPAPAQQHAESYEYVTKVQVNPDNHLYINVTGNFGPGHGCPNHAWARSRFPLSDPKTESQLRIATASLLSGTGVHVKTMGCSGTALPAGRQPGSVNIESFPVMVLIQIQRP